MKRLLFFAVLGVLFVSLFGWVAPALADEGDNFKKAGQKVLQEKELVLEEKKAAINTFVAEIAADGLITGDEMIALKAAVDDFTRTKTEADAYLKFYSLKTSAVLDDNLVKMVGGYFVMSSLFKKDKTGNARSYFVGLTGLDVTVKKTGPVLAGPEITAIILAGICLACVIVGGFKWRKSCGKFMLVMGSIIFLIFAAILLLV